MPEKFLACIRAGGKVFRVKAGENHYITGCKPKGGGKAVYGERKKRKSSSK